MKRLVLAVAVAGYLTVGQAGAQFALSQADREEIQQLSEKYLRLLNSCAAEEYAALFAPGAYFESTFRGRVEGEGGAAELLGINPHTLRARMRKLGVDWRRFRRSGRSDPRPPQA